MSAHAPVPRPTGWLPLLAAGVLLVASPVLAQEGNTAPRVLKGSAIAPAAPAPAMPGPARFRITSGEDLWLFDPEEGDLVACRLIATSTVGRRIVRCFEGSLPRRF